VIVPGWVRGLTLLARWHEKRSNL